MIIITMTLLTFFVGILSDYVIRRKIRRELPTVTDADDTDPAEAVGAEKQAELPPICVEGFQLREDLRYHAGHMWVRHERPQTARAGVDDFGARLAGNIDSIEMPQPRQWVRQGQPIFRIHRKGETVTLLAPVEGEVIDVNPDVVKDPSLLRRDPYGEGWLITLHCVEASTWRNLLPINLVSEWMKDTVSRLYAKQPLLVGAVPGDRGRSVDDLLAAVPGNDWSRITAEFFLP
jgi:glycine cleavage system H lipoate-binding protein